MAQATEEARPVETAHSSRTLATALTAAAAVTAVGAFATLFSLWVGSATPNAAEQLRIATEEYTAGRPAIAAKLAERAGISQDGDLELLKLRQFLVGAGRAEAATTLENDDQQRLAMIEAAEILKASERLGFPSGRERDGYRLLGQALLEAGRHAEAAERLKSAVELTPARRRELLPQLVKSQLLARGVPAEEALQSADQYLALPNLPQREIMEGRLLRGRALRAMGEWMPARQEFRRVVAQADSPDSRDLAVMEETATQVAEAIALRQQSELEGEVPTHVRVMAEEALQTLRELERTAALRTATKARLWAARAYRCLDQPAPALDRLAMVRLARPFGAEATVAGLEEFEILAEQQRETEAAQTIRYLVRETGDPRTFDGRLVEIEEFRERVAAAVEVFREAGNYAAAVNISRSLPPVLARDEALILEGTAYYDWATTTAAEAAQIAPPAGTKLAGDARKRFQAAGDAFAAAAKLRFVTDQYTSTLWSAIDAYQSGREFDRSLELLDDYIRYEDRLKLPRGLVAQGRARLALGRPAQSLGPLQQCIEEYPRDSLRYEARLLAASASAELGDLEDARRLLDANLYDGQLSPESPVWRDSLKLLADLLYREGFQNHTLLTEAGSRGVQAELDADRIASFRTNQEVLENAIRRLEESALREQTLVEEKVLTDDVAQEDAMRRSRSAKYLAAQAHRMAAYWPALEAGLPEVLDATRRLLHRQRADHLDAAAKGFSEMRKTLTLAEEDRALSNPELAMLRNSYLAEADVLREAGAWEEAAEAYRGVSLRYMNAPISLEAMLGQSRCMRQQGRTREAKLVIRQAQKVLNRIPSSWDDQFTTTTRYSRAEWQELLDWLSSSGDAVVAQDSGNATTTN